MARSRRLLAGFATPAAALRRTARRPALVRLQVAWAAVMTASWCATITLTVVAYSTGGSAAVSLAVVARTLPGAVAGPLIGTVVDRGSRHRSMAWAAALCSAACVGAALARHSVVLVVMAMTVVATATMVFRATQSAVVPDLVDDPTDLVAANVVSSAIESAGVFAGPALAGLLLSWKGAGLAFACAAALFAVATLLSARQAERGSVSSPTERPPQATLRDLLRRRTAQVLLSLVLAQTVVSGALVVLYPGLAVRALDEGLGAVGLLTSAFGLGGIVGSLGLFALAGSPRLGVLTAGALALWAVPLALIPAVPSLTPALVLLAVVGAGNVLFDVTSVTLLQRGVPPQLLTRAFGALETVVVVGLALGALAAPPLERLLGPAYALAALGAFLLVVSLAAVRDLRRLDASLVAPTRQVALLRGLGPFTLLPAPELERLAQRLQHSQVAPGEEVVVQGSHGDRYYVVDDGTLTVSVDGSDVVELASGDAFGEIALLLDRPRTATVTARTTATLWSLDGPLFVAALRADGGRALAEADRVVHERLQRRSPRPDDGDEDDEGAAASPLGS